MGNVYMAIDLKSFYASVECVERGLDPLNTNLVVADVSKSEKTICLAVSPSLKQYGIAGRARLFEVVQRVKEINMGRLRKLNGNDFRGKSFLDDQLKKYDFLKLSFIAATPQMAHYIEWSKRIHEIYLKYISCEDIHVYSIDEIFMDVTHYLNVYQTTPQELAKKIIKDIYDTTGITATAGIGTNLYLCKVAMDIVAKHVEADEDGVRIAYLDEQNYRKYLWNHQPITDFWRVGKGYKDKLYSLGLYTMGDIARCSIGKANEYYNEELLYKTFGVNAELLIDHAWGYESCTMKDIKNYKPKNNSIGMGQVLSKPVSYAQTKLLIVEMLDLLALDLVSKKVVTNQIVLTIGYDKENISKYQYNGDIKIDRYGRKIPKHAHGTVNLGRYTSSSKLIREAVLKLYERIINKKLIVRRITISAQHILNENESVNKHVYQLDLFTDCEKLIKEEKELELELEKEKRLQQVTLEIKDKFGKDAILRGVNYLEGAKTRERNHMIGGHKA
jgi:Nucleotidyltransferase/DNA polymerase involved in DNA repair